MAVTHDHREVECKTIDGTTISAWLYEARGPAPAIIMSHGFNCVKEMALPEVAEGFHALGYNVLFYDARSVGASSGSPRNLIDPLQMAEDLSDIVTFVSRLPSVDSSNIILWGLSVGASISGSAAAVDHRVRAVVMVCPLLSFDQPHKRDAAFAQIIRDRVSQLRGNPPHEVVPFNARGENILGMAGSGGPGGHESYAFMRLAKEKGAAGFRDRTALQTYHKLAYFKPTEYLGMVKAPVLMVVPELDYISSPEEQKAAFGRISAPGSRLHLALGKSHMGVATGESGADLVKLTDEFIRRGLKK